MSKIFIETYNEYSLKYKNIIEPPKKCIVQQIYLDLLKFTSNSTYWTRYNYDPDIEKYIKGAISGKYLNELHMFMVKYNFYDMLYSKIVMMYIKITKGKTLQKPMSIDSFFIRNIIGIGCRRNPQYYNKPGLKSHNLVDSKGVCLSLCISSSIDHDSNHIQNLIDNTFIDNNIFQENDITMMADSAYSGLIRIENLTSQGFNILMGKNKQTLKKNLIINDASEYDIKKYKSRVKVENFNAIIQRYPCIICNYEKTTRSYRGLYLFLMSTILAKKINKIINEINNNDLRIKRKIENEKKKEERKVKLENDKLKRIEKEEENKLNIKKREANKLALLKRVKDTIFNNLNINVIKKVYKNRSKKKNFKMTYKRYENLIKKEMTDLIINNEIIKIGKYEFGKKTVYIVRANAYAFDEDNIKTILEVIDIEKYINESDNNVFNKINIKYKNENG
jgi:hypothetical protein